jgi:hypothetical protein
MKLIIFYIYKNKILIIINVFSREKKGSDWKLKTIKHKIVDWSWFFLCVFFYKYVYESIKSILISLHWYIYPSIVLHVVKTTK